jgi:hypothetical protein
MRATSFQIMFPDGDYEFNTTTERRLPSIGDQIERRRQLWTVTRITDQDPAIVYVELVPRRPKPT